MASVCLCTNKSGGKLQKSSNETFSIVFFQLTVCIFGMYGGAPPCGLNFVCRWTGIKRYDYLNEDGVPV